MSYWALQVQQKLGAAAKVPAKTTSGIRGDGTPTIQDVRDPAGWHADVEREPIGAQRTRSQLTL
jgi:hypothetical protein